VVPAVDITAVQWHSWGAAQASGPASAFFTGPGERSPVTLYAFDLGDCGGSYAYQALEWKAPGRPFDPADYLNICTDQMVGQGP
jgi:hypothetical protein